MRGLGSMLSAFAPSGGAAPFDFASLNATQYFDADDYAFVATGLGHGTWPSRASAGNSGNAGYVVTNNPASQVAPTVGTTSNGQRALIWTRATQQWLSPVGGGLPNALDPIASQKTFCWVASSDGAGPNNGKNAGYDNSAFFSDAGQNRANLCARSGHWQATFYDGSFKGLEVPYVDSTWIIGFATLDGFLGKLSLDGFSTFDSAAIGPLAAAPGPQTIGRSSDNSAIWGGGLAFFMVCPVLLDALTIAAMYASLKNRYAL